MAALRKNKYVIVVPPNVGGSFRPLDDLASAYLEGAQRYYSRLVTLEDQQNAELYNSSLRDGLGAGGIGEAVGTQGTSGLSAAKSKRGTPSARPGIASSIKAVNTRRGKFGDTKLHPSTATALKRKGFKVGAAKEIPLRSGQNRPKGEGE